MIALMLIVVYFISFAAKFPAESGNEKPIAEEQMFSSYYHLGSPPLPDSLQFAGENVPVSYYDVREALDKELLVNVYWQSNLLLYCKRAYRYFPLIESILQKESVPNDFKYLALIESGLTNVVSPAKAAGFWQFLKETGLNCGLEINDEVDERYHLEESTVAACRYLKKSYQRYGSWVLAAAAYNMGDGGIQKAMTKQGTTSYWDLLLNDETARYVYRILAAKIILSNPQRYGVNLRIVDLYPPFTVKTIAIDSSITNLVDFAISQGISYKQLKTLNPWLRSDKLTNKLKKQYTLAIEQQEYRNYHNQIKNIHPEDRFEKMKL